MVRRLGALAIVVAQLLLIVRAYDAPIDTFGFQMFPESSQWQADIYRVTDDGLVPISEPWPGGYQWSDLVAARGLGTPSVRHHADAGLGATLFLLERALDWVAVNTPADGETAMLIAEVLVWDNGRGPTSLTLESAPRSVP